MARPVHIVEVVKKVMESIRRKEDGKGKERKRITCPTA